MQFSLTLICFISQTIYVIAAPSSLMPQKVGINAAFFLAGDSTTATQAASGGGWGNGFLTTLANGSFGINYGHNGATTVPFRAGGDWTYVLASVSKAKAGYATFVTIQFGHNDQKPDKNITIAQFSANLKQMAIDVQTAGETPILISSLTRRIFNSSGKVIESLANVTEATIAVAKSNGFYVLDLNGASTKYVNAIGATNASSYNPVPTDYTHLNAAGSVLFGNMVSFLMSKTAKGKHPYDVAKYTKPNATIARAITAGRYIFPAGFGTLVNSTAPAGF